MLPPGQDAPVASAQPSAQPQPASGKRQPSDVEVIEYAQYVDNRIRQTRRMVKVIDVAQLLMILAAGWIVLLIGSAVIEHWVIQGGLTDGGRYAVFGAALVASIGFCTIRLLPILTRRVNPLYAADAIERTTPTLKNTLVNLLQLRDRSSGGRATKLREELEREAAERIVGADGDAGIDRTGVVRLGWVLIALLVGLLGYAVLSPKNPFATAARVLAPWADIAAPTRVRLHDIEPGNAEFAQGESATIRTRVTGLRDDEQVWLISSTADRQQRERRVPMRSVDGAQFELRLPIDSTLGLQQDLAYRIEAGDARSRPFRLRVVTAPTIVVRSVHYNYPEYTGYLDREAPNTGDLRAIEGTRVRIHAVANLPIDTAQIDLGADGRPNVRMEVEGQTATAEFKLELRDDRRTPRYAAYVLRFTTTDGRTNNDPATYRIEVIPDQPPEVEIAEPSEPVRDIGLHETVAVRIRAHDPDFALGAVSVEARLASGRGGEVFRHRLLRERTAGWYEGLYRFTPSEHGLQPGDEVAYWAAASDVRNPQPQAVATRPQRFRILGGQADRRDQRQQGGQNGQNGQGAGEQQDNQPGNAGEQEGGQNGQQQNGQQPNQSNQQGGDSSSPNENNSSGGQEQSAQGDQRGQQEQQQRPEQEPEQGGDSSNGGGLKGEETQGGSNASQDNNGQGSGQGQESSNPPADQPNNASTETAGGGTSQGQPQQGAEPAGGGDRQPAGNQSDSQPGQPSEQPVASDGENDGEAFDRIQDFLEQQKNGQPQSDQQNDSQGGQAQNREGQNNSNGAESGDQGDGTQDQSGQRNGDANSDQRDPSSNAADAELGDNDQTDRRPDAAGRDAGDSAPTQPNNSRQQSDSLGADEPQTPGGGEQGRGEQSPRDGTGSAGETNSADDGQGRAADRGAGDETTAAGDRKQSDRPTGNPGDDERGNGSSQAKSAQGDQRGAGEDRSSDQSSDAGEQAGNQQSEGRQPSESNGAGEQAGEPAGDESSTGDPQGDPRDGRDAAERGSQGDSSRDKQQQRSAEQGGNQAGDPGEAGQQRGEPGEQQQPDRQPSEQGGDPSGERGDASNSQAGSDKPGQTDSRGTRPGGGRDPQPRDGTPPPSAAGDEANLDYARKQTDLILDELADRLRQKNVDRKLLDKLGWTEEELRRFVQRWQRKKQRAKASHAERVELDNDLRSLGLKPRQLDSRVERTKDNQRVGAGYRGKTPAAVRERLRAYNAGVSRGESSRSE